MRTGDDKGGGGGFRKEGVVCPKVGGGGEWRSEQEQSLEGWSVKLKNIRQIAYKEYIWLVHSQLHILPPSISTFTNSLQWQSELERSLESAGRIECEESIDQIAYKEFIWLVYNQPHTHHFPESAYIIERIGAKFGKIEKNRMWSWRIFIYLFYYGLTTICDPMVDTFISYHRGGHV